jgi:hypothetical protein
VSDGREFRGNRGGPRRAERSIVPARVLPALVLSVVAVASIGMVSCSGTPQPNPPSLDASRIGSTRSTQLLGTPGAIEPPDAELWITPLDTASDPQLVMPRPDGSFAATALEGAWQRLQPKLRIGDRTLRGPILDIEVTDVITLPPLSLPCWRVPFEEEAPDTMVGGASEIAIEIVNDCAEPLVIGAAAPRRASEVTVIETPTEIAPGARAAVRALFAPIAEGEREEVVIVDLASPSVERRWVTVFGTGVR